MSFGHINNTFKINYHERFNHLSISFLRDKSLSKGGFNAKFYVPFEYPPFPILKNISKLIPTPPFRNYFLKPIFSFDSF
jgi:hypothetical protein